MTQSPNKAEALIALGATRPADPLNIPLGTEVYDVITCFQGCLMQRIEASGGNIRYAVQPQGDGTTLPEGISFDYHSLLIVGPGCSAVRTSVANPTSIKVLDRVKDKVSGFEGIVNGKIIFLNGCEYLEVQGKATKEFPTGPIALSQAHFWTKVNDGLNIVEKAKKMVKALTDSSKRPPGGPMTRIKPNTAFRG